MQKSVLPLLLATVALVPLVTPNLAWAGDTSFHRVEVPDVKGHHPKALLTFNDANKAIEVQPVKGNAVSIPYSQIDKVSYERGARPVAGAKRKGTCIGPGSSAS